MSKQNNNRQQPIESKNLENQSKRKVYNIRWNEDDNRELRNAVRRFNYKIDKLSKQKDFADKNALPERMSVRALKKVINTRQDLNRELNSLKRFSNVGAETVVPLPNNDNNLKITQWQKKEMSIKLGIINRKRAKRLKEIENLPIKAGGKDAGYTVGDIGMGSLDSAALQPMKLYTPTTDKSGLTSKFRQMQKEASNMYFDKKDEALKNNYIKALKENFGTDNTKINSVIKSINKMDNKEFVKTFKSVDTNFEHIYFEDGEQMNDFANYLKSSWLPDELPK